MPSVQVWDFEDICLLLRHGRLVCDFCSSGQRFASGFLQIPPRDGHPCRSANSSPCRACRGLAPPSKCALPGAQNEKTGNYIRSFVNLSLKAFYVSSNFQIGNWTYPGRHSSMFQRYNHNHLLHDNSKILLQTYRFFSFYLFCSCFHLPNIPHLFLLCFIAMHKSFAR